MGHLALQRVWHSPHSVSESPINSECKRADNCASELSHNMRPDMEHMTRINICRKFYLPLFLLSFTIMVDYFMVEVRKMELTEVTKLKEAKVCAVRRRTKTAAAKFKVIYFWSPAAQPGRNRRSRSIFAKPLQCMPLPLFQ